MIQVYERNGLYIILDTITDNVYPNLKREEAQKLLKKFGREEDRVDYACPYSYYEEGYLGIKAGDGESD